MAVLPRQDDLFFFRHGEDGRRGAEVQSDPPFSIAARKRDFVFGDWRPCVTEPFRGDDAGFGCHGFTRGGRVTPLEYLGPSQVAALCGSIKPAGSIRTTVPSTGFIWLS